MRSSLRGLGLLAATTLLSSVLVGTAQAGPLPDGCTKDKGTVTCIDGPGKNQGGVGTETETQGNTTNTSPDPQELDTSCRPKKSAVWGEPCT